MQRHSFLCLLLMFSSSFLYSQSIVPKMQWYNIYDGPAGKVDLPNDFAMDNMNNIYIAGRSNGTDGTPDVAVLKYSANGELLAEIRYSSGLASWDEAYSIAIDTDLNFWISGNASFGQSTPYAILQKYSSSGELLFAKYFNDDLNINSEGGIVITDSHNNAISGYYLSYCKIAKYSSAGDSLWTISVLDDTSSYMVECLLTDNQDNIFAALSKTFWDGSDLPSIRTALIKISSSGEVLWKQEYESEMPYKMIFDKEDNILIISSDGKLLKSDKDGRILWIDYNSSLEDPLVVITGVVTDTDNNIIITGYGGTGDTWDYVTKKLSPEGNEIWLKTFNGDVNLNDFARSLAIDKENNLYVTGATHNSISTGICYMVKYSEEGDVLWVNQWDAPHSKFESGEEIFVDDSNNVFVAGDVADSTNGFNFFALKIKQLTSTGINENVDALPFTYSLNQNYPNPFNPSTTIRYTVPAEIFVDIKVYDVLGNEIQTLVNEVKSAGSYIVEFNGSTLASGVYICTMKAGDYVENRKLLLLK